MVLNHSAVSLISEGLHSLGSLSRGRTSLLLVLLSLHSRYHVINSKQQTTGLNWGLDHLVLHCDGFPDVDVIHVANLFVITIDSEVWVPDLCVLGSKLSDDSHHIHSTVRGQGLRDDFQCVSDWINSKLPALKGNCSTPSYLFASSFSLADISISAAPPPGTNLGSV